MTLELQINPVPELECFIFEYGTLIGECYPVDDQMHIRSIVNRDKTNDHFIKGFAAVIQDLREAKTFNSVHVVSIENRKLYKYLLLKYKFEIVSATHLKLEL